MADRRMFAKTIIDSDAFLDMPLSTQALYFHLSMRADDEGFVNNPKKIQRMVCASDDDLRVLMAKNFIIPFESGVVVIKHWRIHNYIRADRLMPTAYKEERDRLSVKENGAYTLREKPVSQMSVTCPSSDGEMSAQVSIGKYSVGKVSVGEYSVGENSTDSIGEDTVYSYASKNLICLSPTNYQDLEGFADEMPEDLIKHAIDEACANGARNWAYTRSILRAYIDHKIDTVDKAKDYEEKRRRLKQTGKAGKPMDEREIKEEDFLPDYSELMSRPTHSA